MKEKGKLEENYMKKLTMQILNSLKFIHKENILHRDIKLDNILITKDLSQTKICDFGISRFIVNGQKMTEISGTPAFMCPEVIKGEGYEGFGSDIWALGVVLYSILTGRLPFKGTNLIELHNSITKGDISQAQKEVSKDCFSFLSGLLKVNPDERFSVNDALNHPVFFF